MNVKKTATYDKDIIAVKKSILAVVSITKDLDKLKKLYEVAKRICFQ